MKVSWICSYSKHTWLILSSCCCHLFSTSTLKAWKACFKQLETFLLHQLVKLFVLRARPSQLTIYFPFNFYQFILDTAQTRGTGYLSTGWNICFAYLLSLDFASLSARWQKWVEAGEHNKSTNWTCKSESWETYSAGSIHFDRPEGGGQTKQIRPTTPITGHVSKVQSNIRK